MKKMYLFFFSFLCGLHSSYSPVLASGMEEIKQYQQLQEQQSVDTRFATFYERLQQNPTDPQIHIELGNVYTDRGLYEAAILSFQRALKFNNKMAAAHAGLSKVFKMKNLKLLEAVAMEQAVVLDPQNDQYRYRMGVIYMRPENFDYKKAKKQYKALEKMGSPLAGKLGQLMKINS